MQTSESAIPARCCCPLVGALALKKSVLPADVALSAGLLKRKSWKIFSEINYHLTKFVIPRLPEKFGFSRL